MSPAAFAVGLGVAVLASTAAGADAVYDYVRAQLKARRSQVTANAIVLHVEAGRSISTIRSRERLSGISRCSWPRPASFWARSSKSDIG
jgi:hypothetical protein